MPQNKRRAASKRFGRKGNETQPLTVDENDGTSLPSPLADEAFAEDPLEQRSSAPSPPASTTLALHSREMQILFQTVEREVQNEQDIKIHPQSTLSVLNSAGDSATEYERHRASTLTSVSSSLAIITGAASNLCSATLGAGVLALPYAMREAGIVIGLLLLLGSALATILSIQLLVAAQYAVASCGTEISQTVHSMERIVEFYLGKVMKRVVEVCIVVFCLGCSVSYIIAVGDILNITLGWNRLESMVVMWIILMMPLSMFRRMKSFQWTSGIGVAAIGTLVFSSLLHLINDEFGQIPNEHNEDQSRSSKIDIWSVSIIHGHYVADAGGNTTGHNEHSTVNLSDYVWPANGVFSVLKACPIVLFAFSCQINVPSIYHELEDPQIMRKVTNLAVFICFCLYSSISLIALADFGDRIEPNILVNYKHDSGMMQFATASMAAAVITAFPLNVFPSRITVIGAWRRYLDQRRPGRMAPNENLTAALLEDQDEGVGDGEISVASEGVWYGCSQRALSLDVASDRPDTPTPPVDHPITNQESTEFSDCDDDFDMRQHIAVTLLLTGFALVCAILIPDISVVFGLLGGTTTSMLGFIVPGAIALRLDRGLTCPASFMLVGGIIISLLTTAVTVYSTFS